MRIGAIAVMSVLAAVAGCATPRVQRYATVTGIPKGNIDEYKRMHANIDPGVLARMAQCNVGNYSVYVGQVALGEYCLFRYFEYTGRDFAADMEALAKGAARVWWQRSHQLQQPLKTTHEGQWWAAWPQVFYHAGPAYDGVTSRHGSIIAVSSDRKKLIAYTQLHAAVWPGVLEAIDRANIRNYSIYLGRLDADRYLLFGYFEYVGDDFEADMEAIAQDEVTQVWWSYTDPLQQALETRAEGEWWASLEEIFHAD